ncbi:MAG: hypothetical protein PHG74_15265 [Kiritimatiellae bacterium]|jgi:hypothetical protein|nr:hypothetical protein [Kiritimatiellia bacterium]MDD3585366.1 hypothetical protein [Kiritimatiellia bacterium]
MAGKTGRTQNAERRTPNAEVKAGEHPLGNRLVTGMCEDHAFLVRRGAESRERGRPRPQQRVLQKTGAHACSASGFIMCSKMEHLLSSFDMTDMIVVPRMARRKNLECGDKSRAVRESRHRFLAALCAERPVANRLQVCAIFAHTFSDGGGHG